MAAQANKRGLTRKSTRIEQLDRSQWYTGTELAQLLDVTVNVLSGQIKHHKYLSTIRQYVHGKFGPVTIYSKQLIDDWAAQCGDMLSARRELREAKAAYYAPGGGGYVKRTIVKRPIATIEKKKKAASYLQVVGEGTADTLAELMASIAKQPVKKYKPEDFERGQERGR